METNKLTAVLLTLILALAVLSGTVPGTAEEEAEAPLEDYRILLDGEELTPPDGAEPEEEKAPGLRVSFNLDGTIVLELPFEEAHTVKVIQDGIGENTVVLTGDSVYMEEADCPGHDCVLMGEITRDNLETRVMGGFIICLPHRLAVEVWENK